MGVYIDLILIALLIMLINNNVVLSFKNSYYKQKLDNRGIESSVEGIKTLFDVIKLK